MHHRRRCVQKFILLKLPDTDQFFIGVYHNGYSSADRNVFEQVHGETGCDVRNDSKNVDIQLILAYDWGVSENIFEND